MRLHGADRRSGRIVKIAPEIGYPVMIKSESAGRDARQARSLERAEAREGCASSKKPGGFGVRRRPQFFIENFVTQSPPHRDPSAGLTATQSAFTHTHVCGCIYLWRAECRSSPATQKSSQEALLCRLSRRALRGRAMGEQRVPAALSQAVD